MTKKEQGKVDIVERLARDLPQDVQPSSDLWPDIEARLGAVATVESRETYRWWSIAAAAAVVLIVVSSLSTSMWMQRAVVPTPTIAENGRLPSSMDTGLRAPELLAIGALSDEDRDILIMNLDIMRSTRASIEQALELDPHNTGLHGSWLHVYEQELDLLNEATWTTAGLAERVKI